MQVTDAHDRHTLMTVLQTYYTPTMLEPGHALSPSGVYQSLDLPNHKAYLDYIGSLPIIASPDVFGLHDNADISKDLKETNLLLDSLLLTQSRDAAGRCCTDSCMLHACSLIQVNIQQVERSLHKLSV